MEEQMEKLSAIAQAKPYKIIISKPAGGEIPYRRIVIERKESYYQAAAYTEKQVFHENIPPEKLAEYLGKTAVGQYLQVNAWDDAAEHIYLCSKKGKVTYKTKKKVQTAAKASGSHNRKKQYILEEGTPIEPLVDMGVFTPEGKVDYQALARMIDYVIEGGVDYIVALGTTAETPTLYMPERAVIAMFITNHIAGRVPLVMGCGGNSTSEVLDQLREFDLRGADAILSVTPYYNKPSQEGLYQHFRTVSEHSPLPVILYNIPGRSGVNMTAETTLRLARGMKNVIGIKEASGDIEQMQHILDRRPEGFIVLSGDDGMTLELMRRGGDGVISVAANAFPKRFMECVNYAKAGEFDRAEKAYECLDEAVHALFEEGNPVGVKCALAEMGIIGPTMRLPLVEGSGALREKFRKLIAEYDLR